MHSPPIYVEISIDASLEAVWQHTQDPGLHQQWDLRFTSIEYLPKRDPSAPQRFLYTTNLCFCIGVAGEGESLGTRNGALGESTSALKFWSKQPISLIEEGSGYWKYIPTSVSKGGAAGATRFLTWYDYRVRFGAAGRLFDMLVFRPMIGWATSLSFDVLRLWLEDGTQPWLSFRRWLVQRATVVALALCWIWQGLVPKLLYPQSGELAILQSAGVSQSIAPTLLLVIALAQILLGVLFLLPILHRRLHIVSLVAIVALGVGTAVTAAPLFVAPFGPFTLSLAMAALSVVALLNEHRLPSARNCRRNQPTTPRGRI